MRKILLSFVVLALVAGISGWVFSAPRPLNQVVFSGLEGDAARGRHLFDAGGCAACHAPEGAKDDARLILSGGRAFASPFGTFYAPNISPHAEGIGGWSVTDLGNAMLRGISPEGAHYYPAFPYASYIRLAPQDIADLKVYLDSLPKSAVASRGHDVGFPFNIRRGLGLWKRLYLRDAWVQDNAPEQGRRLVEALGHCGECHTPRGRFGNLLTDRWLGGAPDPSGKGQIPNITPGTLTWSEADLAYFFESGFTPDYDSAGGHMADVIENLKRLPPEDRAAIAAYLKSIPAVAPATPAE